MGKYSTRRPFLVNSRSKGGPGRNTRCRHTDCNSRFENEGWQKGDALRRAMAEVEILEGFLPICAQCKKIRDADGQWQMLEAYISDHTNAAFTHGLCTECARELIEDAGITRNAGGGTTKDIPFGRRFGARR